MKRKRATAGRDERLVAMDEDMGLEVGGEEHIAGDIGRVLASAWWSGRRACDRLAGSDDCLVVAAFRPVEERGRGYGRCDGDAGYDG